MKLEDPQHEGRCEFIGTEVTDSDYIGKSVADFYGHSANPVKYIGVFEV